MKSIFLKIVFIITLPCTYLSSAYAEQKDFDLSLPADYERCNLHQELEQYIAQVDEKDLDTLLKLQKFLLACKSIIEDRTRQTQDTIEKLKELEANK